jgi:hypothetical protein
MCSLCSVLLFSVLFAAAGAHADPFATRDQNPLLAGFGLPAPLPTNVAALPTWDAQFNWSNSAIEQEDGSEHLTVDAETKELRLILAHAWDTHWATRVQIPYREISGGSLDSFIDDWHDRFGLPKGIRPQQPHDRLRIDYSQNGLNQLHVNDPSRGIGDALFDVGYQLSASENTKMMLWTSIKLPTGDMDELSGSEAVDETVAVAAEHAFGSRWTLSAQLAGTHLGDGDLLASQQKSFVTSGTLSLSFACSAATELTAQLDAHSAAFDSELKFLGSAEILTLGGVHRFKSGWRLELGVSEDIAVDASPDVVFVVRLTDAASNPKPEQRK